MTARTYLVAYDIRAPRRLARVHKALSKVGYHLQYSVFAVDLEDWERTKLVTQLRRLIDEKADDVRFYLVPAEPRGAWQGARCRQVRCSACPVRPPRPWRGGLRARRDFARRTRPGRPRP